MFVSYGICGISQFVFQVLFCFFCWFFFPNPTGPLLSPVIFFLCYLSPYFVVYFSMHFSCFFFTFVYLCFTFSSSIIAVLSCFASLFLSNQKAKHYLRVSQCYDDETYTAVVVEILLCIFAFAHYYME